MWVYRYYSRGPDPARASVPRSARDYGTRTRDPDPPPSIHDEGPMTREQGRQRPRPGGVVGRLLGAEYEDRCRTGRWSLMKVGAG